jgi:tetratricopeptide (TPR) repeat protein
MQHDKAIQAANMIQRGWQQLSQNNLDMADETFSDALSALNEIASYTLCCLARIAWKRMEIDKALDCLDRARVADTCFSEAYCLTAEIYYSMNDMERAKEWCEKTLDVNWDVKNAHILLSRINLPGPDYYANIEMIQKYLRPRTYLEIGVSRGETLKFAADETMAVGVDPSPAVDVPLGRMTRVHSKTSDDFFTTVDLKKEFSGYPVDLAFIDGMHLFEFALRDFINIEKYCTADSVVMVHDCWPFDDLTAARERITEFWSGDVWKFIVCLKKYRTDLKIRVIGTSPTGLAIITGLNNQSHVLTDNIQAIYEKFIDMSYDYLHEDKAEKLNLVPNDWRSIENILPKVTR